MTIMEFLWRLVSGLAMIGFMGVVMLIIVATLISLPYALIGKGREEGGE